MDATSDPAPAWVAELGARARAAALTLATLDSARRDAVLDAIEQHLRSHETSILAANADDVARGENTGLSASLIDRLRLTSARMRGIYEGVSQVRRLPDYLGHVMEELRRPNGIVIEKVCVPLGVILMIFEARPNVAVDAAVLALKTGNAVVLRGSSSAQKSNAALVDVMRGALASAGLPQDAVQLAASEDRGSVEPLLRARRHIDVVIPRGGQKLIDMVVEKSTIPVIETGAGICHLFLDASADEKMAREIAINAKTQRPAVCNSIECLLVHEAWAAKHLAGLADALSKHKVELRGCPRTRELVPQATRAGAADFDTEFSDLILAVKIVDSVDDAITHINTHGTRHSEAILTADGDHAARFMRDVDAAVVYHNASTRFTDGFEFGFGAEIGISTQKLHARGPMGLREITTYKYRVRGAGQVR